MSNKDIEEAFSNIVQPIIKLLAMNVDERNKMKDDFLKSFFENIKIIRDDISHEKQNKEKEIEFHNGFIKVLDSIHQDQKIKELKQKEIEFVDLLKKEKSLLDHMYYYLDSFENIISSSEKKDKLKNEIDILTEDLRIERKIE